MPVKEFETAATCAAEIGEGLKHVPPARDPTVGGPPGAIVPASAAAAGGATTDAPWPNTVYAWYVVVVLMLAYTNSYIDRQILSLLIEPIRRDFDISDTQVSLLAGLAFSLFYSLMGLPLARLADQTNRRRLILVGISFWSLMTALCGTARGFASLFLYRVGVGVGEATLSPSALSLLSDCFPRHRLARAISVYSLGLYVGAGLALMIGGLVVKLVSSVPRMEVPLLGTIHSWQLAFLCVAFLGLPIFALVLTIREPHRRGSSTGEQQLAVGNRSDWKTLRAFLRQNRKAAGGAILGFGVQGVAIATYLIWTPSFFIRTYQWDAPTIGWVFGAILLSLGSAGAYAGGYLADSLMRAGYKDGILRSGSVAVLGSIPFVVLMPFLPNASFAVANLAVISFFLSMTAGLPGTAMQMITPNPLRAQMAAIYLLVGNLVGGTLGSTLVALFNDYVFEDSYALRYSMAIVAALALCVSAGALHGSRGAYCASIERAQQSTR